MKTFITALRAPFIVLLSISLSSSAADSPTMVNSSVELELRVKALELKVAELDNVMKSLDGRLQELENSLKHRMDPPKRLKFYNECDAILDRLQDELNKNNYVALAAYKTENPNVSDVSAPIDPEPKLGFSRIVLPLPEDKAELSALCDAVDKLTASDPEVKADSIAELKTSGDHGLAVLIVHGLYHDVPAVRTQSAEWLGTLGGKRVIRELIEAFYSAAYPKTPACQREYIKTLRNQISEITGQDFYFLVRRNSRAPEIATEMINWWQKNWETVPRQLGEPELDFTSLSYYRELKELRTLKLAKRFFGEPENNPLVEISNGK